MSHINNQINKPNQQTKKMKNYIFKVNGTLSFNYGGKDYSIYGKGPHSLPFDSIIVISLLDQGLLEEVKSHGSLINKNQKKK